MVPVAAELDSRHVWPVTPRTGEALPTRSVPGNIRRPEYVGKPAPTPYTGPEVQTPETIEAMRRAGRIAARAMEEAAKLIAPGVTTDELDKVAHEYMCDHGAYPSTLGYRGFPSRCARASTRSSATASRTRRCCATATS